MSRTLSHRPLERLAPILLLGVVCIAPRASADPPTLVADIDLTGEPTIEPCILAVCPPLASFYGSLPSQLVALGDRVLFVANDHLHGEEPWVSDGTPEGTRLVADLQPGAEGSTPTVFGVIGGRAVFYGHTDSGHLWASDGSEGGTEPLTLPCEPSCSSYALYRPFSIHHRGELFFSLYTPTAGAQHNVLYRTDGTSAGTHQVLDLCLPRPNGVPTFCLDTVSAGTVAHGTLYLGIGFAGSASRWLALDDLASAPRDPVPGCVIDRPAAAGDRLLFIGTCPDDPIANVSVYALDGPGVTPRRLAGPFTGSASPTRIGGGPGALAWFSNGSALWLTDGTTAGTYAIPELTEVYHGVGLGDRQLVLGRRSTDGVRGLFALAPGGGSSLLLPSDDFSELGTVGDVAFVTADVPNIGFEAWLTDGTADGTRLVGDIAPGPASSHPGRTLDWIEALHPAYAMVGDRLFFVADDGAHGNELWATALGDEPPPPNPTCTPSVDALCLLDSRFRVEVAWTDFADRSGVGTAVPLTPDTGAFWFFAEPNLELMVKLHDGRAVNGHYWVFYGGLTNVAFTLRVTDTVTGATWEHANPAHQFASGADTLAFPDPDPAP